MKIFTNTLTLINEKIQQVLFIQMNKILEITIQASKGKLVKDKKKKIVSQTKTTGSKINAKHKLISTIQEQGK